MNADELLKRYAAAERNFPNVGLSTVDLREARSGQADLGKADLTRTNPTNANLQGAIMPDGTIHE